MVDSSLSKKHLNEAYVALTTEKKQLLDELQRNQQVVGTTSDLIGDGDGELLNESGREAAKLQRIEEAIRRFHDGIYGLCTECNGPIAIARLKALPFIAVCINCADQHTDKRPQNGNGKRQTWGNDGLHEDMTLADAERELTADA